ncbi:polyprenyl synthetase family protein [Nocardia brasiliensis]|uniref:polyprenyl synthetase family protein n=1 Tax=Nocardia brasiliensis TaxID=37326 RepID=UPI0024539023|nr:polyprenyl synthetase family protein [Nocardia brasiliensis]
MSTLVAGSSDTTARVAGSDVSTVLARARAVTNPILREAISSQPPPFDVMCGYHFGWCDPAGTPVTGTAGKALRPGLAVAAAEACGGAAAAAHAGAAVELLHNFSLVHDDVMDADPIRHGRDTVWKVWGVTNAILTGDCLHALASQVLAAGMPAASIAESATRLAATASELCRGQFLDCLFETRRSVTIGEYLAMSTGKTAALMGCACALGALAAGADSATVRALDEFGRAVGIGFQLVDDVLGIWGDPVVTGKPAGADLARRKWSFPVVRVLRSGGAEADQLDQLYRSREPMSQQDVATATQLLDTLGGPAPTLRYAHDRVLAAFDQLPGQIRSEDLHALAHLAAHRTR